MTKPSPTTRRLGQIDLDTGEVFEHANIVLHTKRGRNGFGKRWFAMSQDQAIAVAEKRSEIGGEGLAVFLLLTGFLDYENNIMISQGEIGQRLSMAKQSVSRAMKKLVDLGCIEPSRTVGKVKYYRLNPAYGWKGKAEDHRKALHANGIYAVK